jgi:hypothetical protein
MVDDPNRKTPRQFQCRDYLWDSFEQLSQELECSIDYLINESMRHYLRAQGRTGASKTGTSQAAMPEMNRTNGGGMMGTNGGMPMGRQPTPAVAARPPVMPAMPPARPPATTGQMARPSMPNLPPAGPAIPPLGNSGRPSPQMPQMPSMGRPSQSALGSTPPVLGGGMPAPPPVMNKPAPPSTTPRPSQLGMSPSAQRTLVAIYGAEEVPVTKEEFFIGRGQKLCDLVIRDTNISRQHARVVLHNGQYWMIDNQSTNGVEFRGAKIQQKRIDEGDVFTICGHDVVFQYR